MVSTSNNFHEYSQYSVLASLPETLKVWPCQSEKNRTAPKIVHDSMLRLRALDSTSTAINFGFCITVHVDHISFVVAQNTNSRSYGLNIGRIIL